MISSIYLPNFILCLGLPLITLENEYFTWILWHTIFLFLPCPTDSKSPASLFSLPHNIANLVPLLQTPLPSSLFHSYQLSFLPKDLTDCMFSKPWSNLFLALRIAPFQAWRKASVQETFYSNYISCSNKGVPLHKATCFSEDTNSLIKKSGFCYPLVYLLVLAQ